MIWVSESIPENIAKFRKSQADIYYTYPAIFMRAKFYRFNNLALSHAGLYFLSFQYFENNEFFCSVTNFRHSVF